MGSIYLGEHLVLGTDVAVKVMAKPWASVPAARTRFLREARMTASVENPHVVRVLDCRHDQADEPYLVLELLHGENLEQRVRHNGVLSVFEVAEIVKQTCSALSAVHAAGIVHRDVKPENIFLVAGSSIFVKLLDFGVARPLRDDECLDVDRLPAGTPQYMSPENMFEPETMDGRSDLFSLAAAAYFALTRRSPFDADSLEGLYIQIEHAKFARPSKLRPELPESIDRWFEKALARNPEDRFQNANAMAEAFEDALRPREAPPAYETMTTVDELAPTELEVPIRAIRPRARTAIAFGLAAAAAIGFVFLHDGVSRAIASAPPPEAAHQDAAPPDAAAPLSETRPAPMTTTAKKKHIEKGSARKVTASVQPAPQAPVAIEPPASLLEILDTVPNPDVAP